MVPKIVTKSELRNNLAAVLAGTANNLVIIKSSGSNKVILDEKEYNRLSALANQFILEDPEGEYKEEFVEEILKSMNDNKIDKSIKNLEDLL